MCSGSVCAEFYTYSITVIEIQVYNTARQTDTIKSKIQQNNYNQLLILLKNNTHFKLCALFFFWRYCTGNFGYITLLILSALFTIISRKTVCISKQRNTTITSRIYNNQKGTLGVLKTVYILDSIW